MTRNVAFFEKYIQNLVITPPQMPFWGALNAKTCSPKRTTCRGALQCQDMIRQTNNVQGRALCPSAARMASA